MRCLKKEAQWALPSLLRAPIARQKEGILCRFHSFAEIPPNKTKKDFPRKRASGNDGEVSVASKTLPQAHFFGFLFSFRMTPCRSAASWNSATAAKTRSFTGCSINWS